MGAASTALPFALKGVASPSALAGGRLPIIVCSRGEQWGRKVLQQAWQVWLDSGNMLDAV
jgi:hypothetical protein